MGFHDRYHTSKAAEEDGTWTPLGDGLAVKVRRPSSAVAKAKRLELEAPFKATRKAGTLLSDKDNEDILVKLLAETLIVDWSGVEFPAEVATKLGLELTSTSPADAASVVVAYSAANAHKIFEAYADFKNEIAAVVFDRDTFKTYVAELDAKNS